MYPLNRCWQKSNFRPAGFEWNFGILEYRNDGMVEGWKGGATGKKCPGFTPLIKEVDNKWAC